MSKRLLYAVLIMLFAYSFVSIGYSTWVVTNEQTITPNYSGQAEITIDNYHNQTVTYDGKKVIDDYKSEVADVKIPTSMQNVISTYYNSEYVYEEYDEEADSYTMLSEKPRNKGVYKVTINPKDGYEHYEKIEITLTINPILVELKYGYKTGEEKSYVSTSDISVTYDGLLYEPIIEVANIQKDEDGNEDDIDVKYAWGTKKDNVITQLSAFKDHNATKHSGYISEFIGNEKDNYTFESDKGTVSQDFSFQITKRTIIIDWSNLLLTYNGGVQNPTAKINNIVSADEGKISITLSTGKKDANVYYGASLSSYSYISGSKYTATAISLDGDATTVNNYALPTGTDAQKEYFISQFYVEMTANDHTITYGDAEDNNGVLFGAFAGSETESILNATITYEYTYDQTVISKRGVGAYSITPVCTTQNTNYHIEPVDGSLTVKQLEATITWTNTDNLIYNGSAQEPTATVTKAYPEDEVTVTVNGAKVNSHIKDNSGNPYDAYASDITNSNYVITTTQNLENTTYKTKFTIGQKDISSITVEFTDSDNFIYRASKITPDSAVTDTVNGKNIIGGADEDYTVSYGENIMVTTGGTVTFTACSNGNYTGSAVRSFEIFKRQLTVTFDESAVSNDKGLVILAYTSSDIFPTYVINNIPASEINKPTLLVEGQARDANITYEEHNIFSDAYELKIVGVDNNSENYTLDESVGVAIQSGATGEANTATLTSEGVYFTQTYYIQQHLSEIGHAANSESVVLQSICFKNNNTGLVRLNTTENIIQSGYTYTYNGYSQVPHFSITNLLPGDIDTNIDVNVQEEKQPKDAGYHYLLIEELEITGSTNYAVPKGDLKLEYNIEPKIMYVDWDNVNVNLDYTGIGKEFLLPTQSICEPDLGLYFNIDYNLLTNDEIKEIIKDANSDLSGNKLDTNLLYEIAVDGISGDEGITRNYILHDSVENLFKEFIIKQVPLYISASANTITYGDDTPEDKNDFASYDGFVNGEMITTETNSINTSDLVGSLSLDYTYDKTQVDLRKVGDYTITPSGFTSNNYAITYYPGTLTVEQLEIEYDWSQLAVTYYADVHTPKTTVTNKPYSEDDVSIVVTGGMKNANAKYGSTIDSIEYINNNPYYATASSLTGLQSENYKLTVVDEEFIIVQRLLTVTALDDSITYGDEVTVRELNSKDGVSYLGFATGEDETVLNGVISYTYSYDRLDPAKRNASVIAGKYDIIPLCTTTNTNYYIEYDSGQLEVLQKEIGIDWTETDVNYTGVKQKPVATATGLISDFNDTCNITVSEGKKDANAYRLSGELFASAYTATAESIDNQNYKLPEDVDTEYKIRQILLTITVVNVEVIYGDSIVFTVSDNLDFDGFVNGETVSVLGGSFEYETTYDQTVKEMRKVNSYDIIGVQSYTSNNYEIQYQNNTFDVIQREITVKSINLETTYNADYQTPSEVLFNNTVYGDLPNPVFDTSYKNANTYSISLTDIDDSNYKITTVEYENFLIKKAPLTITMSEINITYGDSVPNYENYTSYQGFKGEEDEQVLEGYGSLEYRCNYDVTQKEFRGVGSYTVNAPLYTSGNYEITFVSNELKVSQRQLQVTVRDDVTLIYNGDEQIPAVNITNWVYGETVDDIKDELQYSTTIKDAKVYNDVHMSISEDSNYTFEGVSITFEVLPKDITYTWNTNTEGYIYNKDHQAPNIHYDSNEICEGDVVNIKYVMTLNGSNVTESINANNYNISLSSWGNTNYNFVCVDENNIDYTIKPIIVNYTWNIASNYSYIKSHQAPTISYNLNTILDGDSVLVYYAFSKDGAVVNDSVNAGNYTVRLDSWDNSNYLFETVGDEETNYTINPKTVTYTWNIGTNYTYTKSHQAPTISYLASDIYSGDTITPTYIYTKDATAVSETVDAGNYKIKLGNWNNFNYNLVVDASDTLEASYTINSKQLYFKWDQNEFDYTGEYQSPEMVLTRYSEVFDGDELGDSYQVSVTSGEVEHQYISIAAASYNVEVSIDNQNYSLVAETGYSTSIDYVIYPDKVAVTVTDTEKQWDSDNTLAPTITVSGEIIEGEFTYEISYKDSSNNTLSSVYEIGTYTYTLTVTNSNYIIEVDNSTVNSITGEFEITQRTYTEDVSISEVYQAFVDSSLSDVELPDGYSWEDDSTVLSEEGEFTYIAIYTPTDTHYAPVEVEVTVKVISIITITVTLPGIGVTQVEYDRQPHKLTPTVTASDGSTVTLSDIANIQWAYAGVIGDTGFTNVNTSNTSVMLQVTIKDEYINNYELANATDGVLTLTSSLEITPKPVDIVWSNLGPHVYQEFTKVQPTVTVNGIISGDTVTAGLATRNGSTNLDATDVGKYTYVAKLTGTNASNYVISADTLSKELEITAKPVRVEWNSDVNYPYNGSDTGKPSVKITDESGTVIDLNSSIQYGTPTGTGVTWPNVGTYTMTATFTDKNYSYSGDNVSNYQSTSATFNVVKGTPTVNWGTLGTIKEYNSVLGGEQVSHTGYSANIEGQFSVSDTTRFTLEGKTYTKDINSTIVTVSKAVTITFTTTDPNYNSTSTTVDLQVEVSAYNNNTSRYYSYVEDALENATSGHTIYVIPKSNPTIHYDSTIASGVTMIMPYEGQTYYNREGTADGEYNLFADSSPELINQFRQNNVTISDGVTLSVVGALRIGGILGNRGQGLAGQTSDKYTQITMGTNSKIISTGTIECLGYIKEATLNNGSVVQATSGKVTAPFVVYDYRGGSNTAGTYKGAETGAPIMPFNQYDMPNIQSKLIIKSAATYTGYIDVFTGEVTKSFASGAVSATIKERHNTDEVTIVGDGGLFTLNTGGEIHFKYNAKFEDGIALTDNDNVSGRTTIQMYGGASMGEITIHVEAAKDVTYDPSWLAYLAQGIVEGLLNTTVSTSAVLFPVSWKFDIELHRGTYNIAKKVKFMPGSSLKVMSDATANISSTIIFYSSYDDQVHIVPGTEYPNDKAAAYLQVDGKVIVTGSIGGKITTNRKGAVLNLSNASALSVTSYEGYGTTSGTSGVFTLTTTINESAYGNLIDLATNSVTTDYVMEGMIYVSNGTNWIVGSTTFNITYEDKFPEGFSGTSTHENPLALSAGSSFDLVAPTIESETVKFLGWYLDNECTIRVESINGWDHLEDITLYALWDEVETYSVTYHYISGSAVLQSNTTYNESTQRGPYVMNTNVDLLSAPLSDKTGYKFMGWSYSNNPVDTSRVITSITAIDSDKDVYAVYDPYTYTVTYNLNDGDVNNNLTPQTVEYGGSIKTHNITPTKAEDDSYTYTFAGWTSSADGKVYQKNSDISSITSNIILTAKWTENSKDSGCIAAGTLITLADGTYKKVEDLTGDELLLVFNHETGKVEPANIIFIDKDGWKEYRILNLVFSDGSEVKVIYSHGFFDLDENKYVYIDYDNVSQYIGHRFHKGTFDGNNYYGETITLVNAYETIEYTGCYSPVTVYHLNYYTNDLLSMPAGIEGLFNIFEYDENMKYDEELMKQDIEKYGLYTYEDFEAYLPEEIYNLFPAPYFKVSVGKGYITFDEILGLIDRYLDTMLEQNELT